METMKRTPPEAVLQQQSSKTSKPPSCTNGTDASQPQTENICRTCLKSSSSMISVKSVINPAPSVTLLEALVFCLNYDDINDDDFPQQLCVTCAGELLVTYKFMVKARASHETYQQTLPEAPVYIVTYGDEDAISCDNDSNAPSERSLDETNNVSSRRQASVEGRSVASSSRGAAVDQTTVLKRSTQSVIEPQKRVRRESVEVINVEDDEPTPAVISKRGDILHRCELCNSFFTDDKCWDDHVNQLHKLDCEYCRDTFKNHSEKILHYTINHKCGYCKQTFKKREDLITHKRCHTRKCTKCKKMFICKASRGNNSTVEYTCQECLSQPVVGQPKITFVHKCVNCGQPFEHRREFQLHRKKHGQIPCPDCDMLFPNKGTKMLAHAKNHKICYMGCDYCETSFTDLASYQLHQRLVHRCYSCKNIFKSEYDLDGHFREKKCLGPHMVHFQKALSFNRMMRVQCPYCPHTTVTFTEEQYMYEHFRARHPGNMINAGFHCQTCRINFCDIALEVSTYDHDHIWTIQCIVCSMTFNTLHELESHLFNTHGSKCS